MKTKLIYDQEGKFFKRVSKKVIKKMHQNKEKLLPWNYPENQRLGRWWNDKQKNSYTYQDKKRGEKIEFIKFCKKVMS